MPLFCRTFMASLKRFSEIMTFRRVAEIGELEGYEKIFHESSATVYETFLGPHSGDYLVDRDNAIEKLGGLEAITKRMAVSTLETFRRSVDAASLIFAHSILDGLALDFLTVTSIVDREFWEQPLLKRKATLGELKSSSYDKILTERIEARLTELEKESLLTKTDLLFAVCKPPRDFSPIKDFEYDRNRLEEFDIRRHNIRPAAGVRSVLRPAPREG